MRTTKRLQRFYVVEVFRPQPPIPGSQGSETVSLPYGTSAFDRRQYTTRVNSARVEGTSPSTCARSRFPLHPSPPALDGVSIEVLDEGPRTAYEGIARTRKYKSACLRTRRMTDMANSQNRFQKSFVFNTGSFQPLIRIRSDIY